jgi:hypothetical protein
MNKIKSTQKQYGSFTDVTATLDSWQWCGGRRRTSELNHRTRKRSPLLIKCKDSFVKVTGGGGVLREI